MRTLSLHLVGLVLVVAACPAPEAFVLADGGTAVDAATMSDSGLELRPLDAGPDGGELDAGRADAGVSTFDAGLRDAGQADAGLLTCAAPTGLSRGALWQRSHPMFISGLTVVMGSPSTSATNDYLSSFRATAAHTWATGLPDEVAGWVDAGVPYVSWLSSDGTSLRNHLLLGGAAPGPLRIGYQIGDEPADLPGLAAIEAGATAVHAADPEGLVILNFAGSGTDAMLSRAAQQPQFDVISTDQYSYSKSQYAALEKIRAAALSGNKVWWRYLDAYREMTDTDNAVEADFRWDAFVGAVYGFTGHSWFVYQVESSNSLRTLLFETTGDYRSAHTAQFGWAASLNHQLTTLGRTLVLLRSVLVRYVPLYSPLMPNGVTRFASGAVPSLSNVEPRRNTHDALVGLFHDDCSEPYVMVQNLGHPQADFPNKSADPSTFRLSFNFAGQAVDHSAILSLDLDTGVVGERPLSATGAETATLDVTLPAGGVLFFKYKTGRPFVQQ